LTPYRDDDDDDDIPMQSIEMFSLACCRVGKEAKRIWKQEAVGQFHTIRHCCSGKKSWSAILSMHNFTPSYNMCNYVPQISWKHMYCVYIRFIT